MLDFIKKSINMCQDTMRFYKTVFELSNLNDRELKDLGLSRDQIPMVAMKATLTTK
jgi:uncharacterized protein YjiS (DUF1127 family)